MAGGLNSDPLFLGLTRPPLLFGVSYTFSILNVMVCMIAFIETSEIKWLAIMFPIHGIGYYLCSKEPLFLDLFMVSKQKCSRCPNKLFHGANSYDPF